MTRRRAGRILLWIGIVAWFPYGILKYGLGHDDLPATPFLVWHLCGVVPGSILARWRWIRTGARWLRRKLAPRA